MNAQWCKTYSWRDFTVRQAKVATNMIMLHTFYDLEHRRTKGAKWRVHRSVVKNTTRVILLHYVLWLSSRYSGDARPPIQFLDREEFSIRRAMFSWNINHDKLRRDSCIRDFQQASRYQSWFTLMKQAPMSAANSFQRVKKLRLVRLRRQHEDKED